MASFNYTVLDKEGKQAKGTIESESRDMAIGQLKGEGNTIISLEEASALNKSISIGGGGSKPNTRDLSVFCRQFVAIVDAGVPVITALGMLSEQTENKMLCDAIIGCKKAIEKGSTLADAMRQYPKCFSNIFITMVQAGEESGSLSNSFARIGKQYEKQHELQQMIKKTSIYPTVLILVTIVVVIIMMEFVIPQFKDMLESLDTELPAITKFVMACSDGMKKYWYIIASVVAVVVIGYQLMKHNEKGREMLDTMQIKSKIRGNLCRKQNSASFTRTLSTLLSTGIPMMEALGIVSGTVSNVIFTKAILAARDAVSMGSNLSIPLRDSGIFPPLVHHMISIGEETGDIDGMLDKVADYYDEEVKEATEQMMAMMEPMIIIILAVIVGTIALAVISPMASMYSALDNA